MSAACDPKNVDVIRHDRRSESSWQLRPTNRVNAARVEEIPLPLCLSTDSDHCSGHFERAWPSLSLRRPASPIALSPALPGRAADQERAARSSPVATVAKASAAPLPVVRQQERPSADPTPGSRRPPIREAENPAVRRVPTTPGGCGCRVQRTTTDLPVRLVLLALGMLVLARRRRGREPVRPRPGT